MDDQQRQNIHHELAFIAKIEREQREIFNALAPDTEWMLGDLLKVAVARGKTLLAALEAVLKKSTVAEPCRVDMTSGTHRGKSGIVIATKRGRRLIVRLDGTATDAWVLRSDVVVRSGELPSYEPKRAAPKSTSAEETTEPAVEPAGDGI